MIKRFIAGFCVLFTLAGCSQKNDHDSPEEKEPHRPDIHFTPAANWMNDPNGLVYHEGVYHLYYQYFPDSTVWGPMHWGHATSTDLIHWSHQPVALYPDSLGYIFSGSAVADIQNTAGFKKDGKIPLVAIFTHHDPGGEAAGRTDYQNQSLAYSLDNGHTWTKYAGNPVLKNTGVKDFRDPKVRWHEGTKRWIMTLATLDRITFFSSPDLKNWTKESEFGKDAGAHGGVWECPDLFPISADGKDIWVLLVSINPGGPNGGSATQYFTGTFDGHEFSAETNETRWLDHGPDNYAGVTWSNTGDRNIFLGWMSNWLYAELVPTEKWRSAMTIPRDLSIQKLNGLYQVRSMPVPEIDQLVADTIVLNDIQITDSIAVIKNWQGPGRLHLRSETLKSFNIVLSNNAGEHLDIGYEIEKDQYYIDRSASGKSSFKKEFAARLIAPRIAADNRLDLILVIDRASVELFADGGLTSMTAIFFPQEDYSAIHVKAPETTLINTLRYEKLQPALTKESVSHIGK